MAKMRYVGLSNPIAEIEKLRPAREVVMAAMLKYHPASAEYRALLGVSQAILEAGRVLVPSNPYLFASRPCGQS
jgi:hypothetical protein